METVCLNCGDVGFQVALILCADCRGYALHRYCLKGPVIFTDSVTWYCEDCATKLGIPPSLDQSTPITYVPRDSLNLENNAIQAAVELRNCIQNVKKSSKQKKKKIKNKQKKGKVNSGFVAKTNGVLSASCSSPKLERPVHSISGEEEREVENGCGPAPSDVDNSDVGEEKSDCGPVRRGVGNSNVDFKSVSVSLGATNNDSGCAELGGCVYAQPIIEPIWRGSIYFCNETIGTVSGLLAHMSNLACSKVAEEARHLAEVLHAELVPKSMVWPESFKTREPTDQDIALFFFPDSEGAEKDFDALVDDIISHGHAIRFVAKNAELLIFSSIELPIPCWRFESKYFLWGVFRNNSKFRDQ